MSYEPKAVQVQVIINGKSFTIDKKHLSSLNMKRTFGEAANEFTLEVFDETAYIIESQLIGESFPSITIKYAAAKSFNNTILFTGTCLDYTTTFVGRGMMLTIKGIVSAVDNPDYSGWWFEKACIEWCGSEPSYYDGQWHVDGKGYDQTKNFKDNEDVCAIMVWGEDQNKDNETDTPEVYFNPTRIFKRIIHKYNGDKLGTDTSAATTVGSYDAGEISDVKLACWNYLRNKGFSLEATAGVMGNIQAESGFEPSRLQGGGGPAAGLCQWENYKTKSGRWKSLYDYANSKGKSWTDIGIQLEFMLSEMSGMFNTYTGWTRQYNIGGVAGNYYGWPTSMTLNDYKRCNNMNEAAEIFMRVFERPSDIVNGVYRPSLPRRKQYANGMYTTFKDSGFTDKKVNDVIILQKDVWGRDEPNETSQRRTCYTKGMKVRITQISGNYYRVMPGDYKGQGEPDNNWVKKSDLLGTTETTSTNETPSSTIAGWGTGGTGNFIIAEADESRWIKGLVTTQAADQTAAQYITQVLCRAAITDSGSGTKYQDETAGFKYFVDKQGHHFKALGYNDYNSALMNSINVSYGIAHSEIISFSVADIGSVAMVYGNESKRGSINVTSSAISDLYGDQITAGGENVLGVNELDSVLKNNKSVLNWYSDAVPAVQVKSSSTESELTANWSNTYSALSQYAMTAELTIWGEYSKTYTPGGYVWLTVYTNITDAPRAYESNYKTGNIKHYSDGLYMITALEDSVTSGGYIQTMRLLKLSRSDKQLAESVGTSTNDLQLDEQGHIIAKQADQPAECSREAQAKAAEQAVEEHLQNSKKRIVVRATVMHKTPAQESEVVTAIPEKAGVVPMAPSPRDYNWCYCYYNGHRGYIHASDLGYTRDNMAANTYMGKSNNDVYFTTSMKVVNTSPIYSYPSPGAQPVEGIELKAGETATIIDLLIDDTYYKIRFKSPIGNLTLTGYVKKSAFGQ